MNKKSKLDRAKAIIRYAKQFPDKFPSLSRRLKGLNEADQVKMIKRYPEFSSKHTPAWLRKTADVLYEPHESIKGERKIVSGGIFIGTEKDHKQKSEELEDLLKKHRSLQKTRVAYQKKYPNDYTTTAFKKAVSPKKPLIFGKKKYRKKMER